MSPPAQFNLGGGSSLAGGPPTAPMTPGAPAAMPMQAKNPTAPPAWGAGGSNGRRTPPAWGKGGRFGGPGGPGGGPPTLMPGGPPPQMQMPQQMPMQTPPFGGGMGPLTSATPQQPVWWGPTSAAPTRDDLSRLMRPPQDMIRGGRR